MESSRLFGKWIFGFLSFLAARAIGMILVAIALPWSHMTFGERYEGDGQQAFGFIIAFFGIGILVAFVYLAAATFAHFLVRKKSYKLRFLVEIAVFAIFIIMQVYAGTTAHYTQK